jgi:hypothetical protein
VAASRGYRPSVLCNGPIYVKTEHPMDFEGPPADDSLLKPGATDAWELKYGFGSTYAAELKTRSSAPMQR